MKKKLQVFISSTFTDLQEERQAAVEAVLNAGHIPAGMELFKSGDVSQKEVIKKWINDSDVYMLILGGRYGVIDEETGISYTHWEYEYAGEIGKPRFAIIIHEEALENKVKELGSNVIEKVNYPLYENFRKLVLEKISKFYTDNKDIKLVIYESLKEFERREDLTGWISGKEVTENHSLLTENYNLLKEVTDLKKKLNKMATDLKKKDDIEGNDYEEILKVLKHKEVVIPIGTFNDDEYDGKKISLFLLFIVFQDDFTIGITNNASSMSKVENFLFYYVAPILITYGLLEKIKLANRIQRVQTSKAGLKFLKVSNNNEFKQKQSILDSAK
ncbi:hypothetical protein FIU87_05520 [Bacillus sp. THAF10]|uniref:DUF4062 domain-containing protein n=1 Tax=Bacillus sp. THAF10 TaxID=2587848 RepID=UPI0012689187|nr:DUF4062 domain-containing protein [Bacillus sp. THAF10]QFT88091.1 hypothetical protein FIU87_05520 [Bacillus sp. THAF10]